MWFDDSYPITSKMIVERTVLHELIGERHLLRRRDTEPDETHQVAMMDAAYGFHLGQSDKLKNGVLLRVCDLETNVIHDDKA